MDTTDEVAKRAESKQTSTAKTLSGSLTTQQIVLGGGVLLVLFYFVYIWKKMEVKEGFVVLIVCAGILYLLSTKGDKGIIPIKEATALLKTELKYMQKETKQLPPGRINMRPHFKLKNFDYKPNRYYIGFEIIQWNDLRRVFVGEVDPYSGRILAVVERTDGFDATDIPANVQWMPSKDELGDKWRDKYGYR